MKMMGSVLFFALLAILLTLGFHELTGFSILISSVISAVTSILLFLMLDQRPKDLDTKDTVYRLTRGTWYKRKS